MSTTVPRAPLHRPCSGHRSTVSFTHIPIAKGPAWWASAFGTIIEGRPFFRSNSQSNRLMPSDERALLPMFHSSFWSIMNAFSLCAFACRSMISFTFSGCPGLPIATANCSNVSIRSAGWLGCCSAAGVVDLGGSMRAVTLERFCRLGARTGCWGGLTTASWPAGPFLWLRVRTRDPDGGEVGRISCVQGGAETTTSGPAWWASAFGTIIEGAGAERVPALKLTRFGSYSCTSGPQEETGRNVQRS